MDGRGRGRPLPNLQVGRGVQALGGNFRAPNAISHPRTYNPRGYNTRSAAAAGRPPVIPFRGLMPIPRPRISNLSSCKTRFMSIRKPGTDGSAANSVVLDSKMSFPKDFALSSPKYGAHLAELEANLARLNEADKMEEEDDVPDPESPILSQGNDESDALSPNAFADYYAEREAGLAIARAKGEFYLLISFCLCSL